MRRVNPLAFAGISQALGPVFATVAAASRRGFAARMNENLKRALPVGAAALVVALVVPLSAMSSSGSSATSFAFGRVGGNIQPFTVTIAADGSVLVNGPAQPYKHTIGAADLARVTRVVVAQRFFSLPRSTQLSEDAARLRLPVRHRAPARRLTAGWSCTAIAARASTPSTLHLRRPSAFDQKESNEIRQCSRRRCRAAGRCNGGRDADIGSRPEQSSATSNSKTFTDSTGEDPNAPDITTIDVSNDDAGLDHVQGQHQQPADHDAGHVRARVPRHRPEGLDGRSAVLRRRVRARARPGRRHALQVERLRLRHGAVAVVGHVRLRLERRDASASSARDLGNTKGFNFYADAVIGDHDRPDGEPRLHEGARRTPRRIRATASSRIRC